MNNTLTQLLQSLPPQFLKQETLGLLPTETKLNLSKYDEYTKNYVLKFKDKFFPKPEPKTFDETKPTDLLSFFKTTEFGTLSTDELDEFLGYVTEYTQMCLLESLVSTFDFLEGFTEPYNTPLYEYMFDKLNEKYPETFNYDYLNDSKYWQSL